jgi:dihydroxyacetone kinase
MMPADALVERLLSSILSDRRLGAGDRVALLVNGLGGTPPMELAIVARHAFAVLRARGLTVERAWSGTFMSALEMPGVSLSLLRVDDERLALLDATTTAPAWAGSGKVGPRAVVAVPALPPASRRSDGKPADPRLSEALVAVAAALEASEGTLTDLDSRAGDGDLGASMVRAAGALRVLAREPWSDPATLLAATADSLRRAIGGSSGPFYATGLLRAARRLPPSPRPSDWAQAFEDAVAAIGTLGGAKPGDRTMIDALAPAASTVSRLVRDGAPFGDVLKAAALAAETGADATAGMAPHLGRASYLGQRALGVADGGAVAVAIWLRALADRLA